MQNGYQNYFDNEILGADPLKLVQLMYRGALDAVGCARLHLRAGNIRERSRAITRAMAIVHELSCTLDHARGGEVSKNLAGLYDYIERQLINGNSQQTERPLKEAEQLLLTLLEAWETLTPAQPAPAPPAAYAGQESESLSYA
jgi:flagellar secretion chaperone FliS